MKKKVAEVLKAINKKNEIHILMSDRRNYRI